jgi:hypothetical protein
MQGERNWRRMLWSGVVAAAVAAVALGSGQVRLNGAAAVALAPDAQGRGGGGGGVQGTSSVEPLHFRYMGPAPAGRIAAVVGVPGDGTTWYVGSASGGVWKSTDSGSTFTPVFDEQPVQAIGSLAIAPTDSSTVWAGTGEPWLIRYGDVMGDGVYKSTDAGATWKNMGLKETGRIARVLVHPTNASIVYVCAVGRGTGPQQERGVFKTTDGGATWKNVHLVNELTGCSGLSIDQADPNTLIEGTWTFIQHTYGEFTAVDPNGELKGKEAAGVYITHDGGTTWKLLSAGLPHQPVGKVDVAIAASNSKIMYALMQTADQGSLWRSDDAGVNWHVTSWERYLIGRAGYYIRLAVNPVNPENVLISSSGFHQSTDGGKHFSGGGQGGPGGGGGQGGVSGASCGDCHDIWMDPKINGRYALTDDGGASLANGQGGSVHVSLPNGQMYHVFTDNRVPYWIYSNRQDDGTMRGPSTVSEQTGSGKLPPGSVMTSAAAGGGGRGGGGGRAGGGGAAAAGGGARAGAAPVSPEVAALQAEIATLQAAARGGGGGGRGGGAPLAWQPNIGGCESGFTIPDPKNADIVWATCYGNKLTRWDARTNTAHSVEPNMLSLDSPPNEAKYRCHWTAPLAIDPFNTEQVYYGCQMILMTKNKGQSWTEFSADLSTKDPRYVTSNGGLVGDNLGQYDGEVVWSIAPSQIQPGLLWVGTNDGKMWLTKTANAAIPQWNDVSANMKIKPWAAFPEISPSQFDAGTAYAAVDYHLMDDRKPMIMKTTDFGVTWTNITGDLPATSPLDYVLSVAENPNKKGMLFAGTGHGFYYSMNDGAHWTQFKDGLPAAPVSWITIEKRFHDVAISTYGRGLYILPNITLLEQTGQTAPPAPAATQLYAPAPVIRQARNVYQQAGRPHFIFSLTSAPSQPIKMEILDMAGKVIKTEQLSGHQGLNGATWDLRYDGPTLVALKTTPPENPHIWEELRFQNADTRTITHWGITGTTGVPIAAPGKYQVRITVDGKPYTQPFDVIKDPAVVASDADLVASSQAQVRARDDISATSGIVNRIELMRRQLEDAKKANAGKADVTKAIDDLDKKFLDVELKLVTRSEMLSDDKYFPEAYKVYMNLIWLSGGIGQGASDEAGGVDFKPTDQQVAALTLLEGQLAGAKAGLDKIVATDIPAFNTANAGKIPALVIK